MTENTNKNIKAEEKKVSFKASKDLTKEEIEKLDKVVAKVCKVTSKKSKSTYYTFKFAIYRESGNYRDRLVVVKSISEVLALIIAKRRNRDFLENDEFSFNCPIRYSKGKRKGEEDGEYYAYDLFICDGKRLFDFFTQDELDYLNDYGYKLKFEDRVYFDEDGYKYESLDF